MPSATPRITSTALLACTPHDKAMLQDVHELLNKIFIRNRNQHRRSHWWKSLQAFRKQIQLLLQDLDRKKSERAERLQLRLRYWDEKCIHMWYYQFSQLVSVGPFAMLGLVMMASVARVCRITGITAVYEEIASGDVQGVLTANDDLALADEFSGVLGEGEGWDEGVLIARKDMDEDGEEGEGEGEGEDEDEDEDEDDE